MIGFGFTIRRRIPGAVDANADDGPVVAKWSTGFAGTRWLDRLAEAGGATFLGGDGYPFRWTISAGMLRRAFANGIPRDAGLPVVGEDYALPADWFEGKELDLALLRALPDDEILSVVAWDLS